MGDENMEYKTALQAIAILSAAGLLFSGYLSYGELFANSGGTCTLIAFSLFGLPSCVYGFLMYALILSLSVYALWKGGQ